MKRTLSFLVIFAILTLPILARPSSVAIGAQLGFTSTGVVADLETGPVALDIGANFPAGLTYIQALTGDIDLDIFSSIFTLTADLSYPIRLGPDFSLKMGLGTTLFSDFSSYALGLAGAVIKGEYWIKGGPFGLFAKIDVPIYIYAIGDSSTEGGFDPALPLFGFITSTAGLLYAL